MVQIQSDKAMVELRPDLSQGAEVSEHIRGKQRERGRLTVYLHLWSANSCRGDKGKALLRGLVILLSFLVPAMPEAFYCLARTGSFPLAFS